MKNKTLLLVGGTDEMVRKAKALGLRVLVFQHPERAAAAPCPSADVLRIVDYTDLTAVAAAAGELREAGGFAAAVAFKEPARGAAPLTDGPDIDRFADRYGYPLIVKPVDGTASYGVFRLDGPRHADAVWQ